MQRIVADLGNSRLKWARLDANGAPESALSLPVDDSDAWSRALDAWNINAQTRWAISSVNPPLADRLRGLLDERGCSDVRWFPSAAEVPVPNELETIGQAGADRALAVLAAIAIRPAGRSGHVVSCGTAVTVERISAEGVWLGGAIAPGLGPMAQALRDLTAQLPLVEISEAAPASWGRSTLPALKAGLFWGQVGVIREILARQSEGLTPRPWIVWTGGDASLLAPWVEGPSATLVPDLVLRGLAIAAFGERGEGPAP